MSKHTMAVKENTTNLSVVAAFDDLVRNSSVLASGSEGEFLQFINSEVSRQRWEYAEFECQSCIECSQDKLRLRKKAEAERDRLASQLRVLRQDVQSMPETPNSKSSQLDNNTIGMEDDCNTSICSGSQSLASRQSDLSSLTGSRLGRRLFYGSAAAADPAAQGPFPEDWQYNIIHESIENDEDLVRNSSGLNSGSEREFHEFVNNGVSRQRWEHAELECQRLSIELTKCSQDKSWLEQKLQHARLMLDSESHLRKKSEEERNRLASQLHVLRLHVLRQRQHIPGRRDAMPEIPNSKFSQLDNNTIDFEDECSTSICSGSQSILSRQSDLSSLTGSRFGRGLFYGSAVAADSAAPVCPFPEDWQFNTIPKSIENDDDID